ncbi:hypothetical protein [Halobacterium litoreum]|uniref:CopG family transcriptional regulator n=1 Tax=Halobacterium litoreum TaxID=2039234 RepID=A0ABD5NDB7_9EURY|nr:hypothetical protein [Halobacterium litoreum]UHH13934.1 hypothetical protein LT972_02790 [Halobacterium litoreum]
MADGTSDGVESATLEGPAAAWLGERADDLGVSTEELLQRVVAAYRRVEDDELAAGLVTEDDLDSRLDEVEGEYDEKIQDVRERVIQVKREADGKAPADHGHADVEATAEDAAETAERVASEFEALSAEVEEMSGRLDAGFENFEEVLSYLRDETDELGDRTTTLATAVLSMRESVRALAAAEAQRGRAEQLQREANVEGVEVAACESCEQSVSVALLSAPECPFCGATFEGVEAKTGWFGAHTLETGTKPALPASREWLGDEASEGAWLGGDEESLEAMVEENAEGASDDSDVAPDPDPEPTARAEAEVVDVDEPLADATTEEARDE